MRRNKLSVIGKHKTKRAEKKLAKSTGNPYVKYKRTKKGRPGENLMKAGAALIGAGGIHSATGKYEKGKGDPNILRGLAVAGAGVGASLVGAGIKGMKRNQPTAKPVTKKTRRKNITKTRHVTPTGVTRTKTKKYKKK
jgi:hypothetical protein